MGNEVDLQQLAINREPSASRGVGVRRHFFSRYVLPAALLGGFLTLTAWAARERLFPPKPVTVVPVFVTQAAVQRAGTPLFKAAGWIEPRPTPIRIAALAPGVVSQLLVVEDQLVEKGMPVAELIKDDAELNHKQKLAIQELRKAEFDEAKAMLTAAKKRFEKPVHLEERFNKANAEWAKNNTLLKNLPYEIKRAESEWKFAREDYAGKKASAGSIAGRFIDEAYRRFTTATAQLDELKNRKVTLRQEQTALKKRCDSLQALLEMLVDEKQAKETAAAKLNAANARLKQATIAVVEAKLRLDRMTVRAAVDGRVYQLIGHPGARIGGGGGMTSMKGHDGSTIITLYQPKMLQVRVDVRFQDIPKVQRGQSVQIENSALSSPLIGTVLFVSSEADIQKNTLQVKVAIPKPPSVFKPEMLVDVTFLAMEEKEKPKKPSLQSHIYIPKKFLQQSDDGPFVWVADQSEGVAKKVPVKTGAVGANGMIEITSGLEITSRIIASGFDGLTDGDRIRITGEEKPSEGNGDGQ